jgi:hypothetical protein
MARWGVMGCGWGDTIVSLSNLYKNNCRNVIYLGKFKEIVPFLEAQHKYEKLLAEISEFKFKRFQYDMQHASAMYQMQHPEEQESEERYAAEKEPAKESKRSLKKN